MEDLGWLKVLEEFDDLARVYHCLKYDAESCRFFSALVSGTLHNTDGGLDEYSGELDSAKSSTKFDVVSAKLDVFNFELLLGAKRLKI